MPLPFVPRCSFRWVPARWVVAWLVLFRQNVKIVEVQEVLPHGYTFAISLGELLCADPTKERKGETVYLILISHPIRLTIWFKYIFNILRSSSLHCKKMWQIFEFTFVYVNAYAMVVFVKSYVFLFFQGLKKFYKGNILFYAICSFRIICISNIPTIFFIKLYTFITVTNTSYVAAANINYCEHSLCNLVMFSLYLLCCILRNFYAPLCTQFKEV